MKTTSKWKTTSFRRLSPARNYTTLVVLVKINLSFFLLQTKAPLCHPEGRECINAVPKGEYNCHKMLKPCEGLYADIEQKQTNTTLTEDTEWSKLLFKEYEEYKRGYLKELDKNFLYDEILKSKLLLQNILFHP